MNKIIDQYLFSKLGWAENLFHAVIKEIHYILTNRKSNKDKKFLAAFRLYYYILNKAGHLTTGERFNLSEFAESISPNFCWELSDEDIKEVIYLLKSLKNKTAKFPRFRVWLSNSSDIQSSRTNKLSPIEHHHGYTDPLTKFSLK